jgi:hypothetical protein
MRGYLNYCSVVWGLYTCKGHGNRAMVGEGKGISLFMAVLARHVIVDLVCQISWS